MAPPLSPPRPAAPATGAVESLLPLAPAARCPRARMNRRTSGEDDARLNESSLSSAMLHSPQRRARGIPHTESRIFRVASTRRVPWRRGA
eukprot:scaffold5769_cov402-Prasinococcus_capsulatus_cf.AAC.3